jgi:hypothetical protein
MSLDGFWRERKPLRVAEWEIAPQPGHVGAGRREANGWNRRGAAACEEAERGSERNDDRLST